jgi:hypothetical protein
MGGHFAASPADAQGVLDPNRRGPGVTNLERRGREEKAKKKTGAWSKKR